MNTIHTLGQNHVNYMQSKCIWKLIFGNTKSWFGIFFSSLKSSKLYRQKNEAKLYYICLLLKFWPIFYWLIYAILRNRHNKNKRNTLQNNSYTLKLDNKCQNNLLSKMLNNKSQFSNPKIVFEVPM